MEFVLIAQMQFKFSTVQIVFGSKKIQGFVGLHLGTYVFFVPIAYDKDYTPTDKYMYNLRKYQLFGSIWNTYLKY